MSIFFRYLNSCLKHWISFNYFLWFFQFVRKYCDAFNYFSIHFYFLSKWQTKFISITFSTWIIKRFMTLIASKWDIDKAKLQILLQKEILLNYPRSLSIHQNIYFNFKHPFFIIFAFFFSQEFRFHFHITLILLLQSFLFELFA